MVSQLSKKAALPLAKILGTCRNNVSNTGPSSVESVPMSWHRHVNTLRPRQNGRHFPDDIFKCIFVIENVWISIKISLKFVPTGPINNIPALVQTMAWRRPGDKPLSEPMMVRSPTYICVTRPQWVKMGKVFRNLGCLETSSRFRLDLLWGQAT